MIIPTEQMLAVGAPLPANIGACVDLLAAVRDMRLEHERRADQIKKRETEIETHIIASIESQTGLTGVAGQVYKAQLKPTVTPVLDDWGDFSQWLLKTGQTQVLYKRLNTKAVMEMVDDGAPLPNGVSLRRDVKLSLTKV